MLKKLRHKGLSKKIWVILAILILPAFLFWGLGGIMHQKENRWAGKIGKRKISNQEFRESLLAVKNIALMQYGKDYRQKLSDDEIKKDAWLRLILLEEAKKEKIKVTDQEVIEKIQNYGFFKPRGKFDLKIYENALRYFFQTPVRTFEEQIRQNMMIEKLFKNLTVSLELSDEELKEGYLTIKKAQNPNFEFEEEKFLTEKELLKPYVLEEKKARYLNQYSQDLLKKVLKEYR